MFGYPLAFGSGFSDFGSFLLLDPFIAIKL